jgi:hypothetical protein
VTIDSKSLNHGDMRKSLATVLSLMIGVTGSVASQSRDDAAANVALAFTPVGALPPLVTSTIQGEAQRGVALGLRYGYVFGLTAILPFGLGSTVSLTGGLFSPNCDDCDSGLMLSIGADRALGEIPFGSGRDGSRLRFALNGELGYGQPKGASFSDGSLMSGAVGIPISLVSGSRNRDEMRIVPFVTPGFGFGGTRGDGSTSGTALMIGGGVGIYNRSNSVALSFGFQHIAVENAGTQIGLALVLGGR